MPSLSKPKTSKIPLPQPAVPRFFDMRLIDRFLPSRIDRRTVGCGRLEVVRTSLEFAKTRVQPTAAPKRKRPPQPTLPSTANQPHGSKRFGGTKNSGMIGMFAVPFSSPQVESGRRRRPPSAKAGFIGDRRGLCPNRLRPCPPSPYALLLLIAPTEASRIAITRIAAPHSFSEGIGAGPIPGTAA